MSEVGEILRARAAELARRVDDDEEVVGVDVAVFRVAGERYAVDAGWVMAATLEEEVTPLPATPAWLAGVTLWRSEVLPVVCLARLLGLSREPGGVLMVIGQEQPALALRASAAEGVERVPSGSLRAADALAPGVASIARGITPAALIVLEIERLLDDPRLDFADANGETT